MIFTDIWYHIIMEPDLFQQVYGGFCRNILRFCTSPIEYFCVISHMRFQTTVTADLKKIHQFLCSISSKVRFREKDYFWIPQGFFSANSVWTKIPLKTTKTHREFSSNYVHFLRYCFFAVMKSRRAVKKKHFH